MLSVWSPNASIVTKKEDFDGVPFHQTAITKIFLSDDTQKLFVCGLKGIGKTILIKRKSAFDRRKAGITFIPKDELVEKMVPLTYSMSATDISDLTTATAWSRLWQLVLTIVILRRIYNSDIDTEHKSNNTLLPAELNKIFSSLGEYNHSVAAHLNLMLALGPNERRQITERYSANILGLLSSISHGIHVYVDAIDDLVYSHSGIDLKTYEEDKYFQFGTLANTLWVAAQVGFAQAASAICINYSHIKIFGAFRWEALKNTLNLPDRQNLEPYILHLSYSIEDLKKIFITKLEALRARGVDGKHYFTNTNEDIVEAFFGIKTILHPFVTDQTGDQYPEPVLDYIIRHTRGRPRELDVIGESIQIIENRPRTEEEIRRCVRDKSRTFFEWARDEMIPFWEESRFSPLLEKLTTNIFERKKIDLLMKQIKSKNDLMYELFEVGLIGCAIRGENGKLIQRFNQNDPSLAVSKEDYNNASYLTIHPCVNLATRSIKKDYTANHDCVAGHGYPLHQVDQAKHIHFGAGNLGLGLVLPVLAANKLTCVCIIQRPSNSDEIDWTLLNDKQLTIHSTVKYCAGSSMPVRDKVLDLLVITDNTKNKTFDDALIKWQFANNNLLILTNSTERIHKVLDKATSVSTSIKSPDRINEIGSLVINHGNIMAIYPFENDEVVVNDLENFITKNSNTKLIRTCSDRICTDRRLNGRDITVNVEDYFRLIVNDNSKYTKLLLGMNKTANGNIVFINDKYRYKLESEAKRLLVNGLHLFFAVDVIGNIYKKVRNKDERDFLLNSSVCHLLMTQDVQEKLSELAELFQIYLLSKAEHTLNIKKIDELLTFKDRFARIADSFFTRVTTSPDHITRIIRPQIKDVAPKYNRFSDILLSINDSLRTSPLTNKLIEDQGKNRQKISDSVNAHLADLGNLLKFLGDQL